MVDISVAYGVLVAVFGLGVLLAMFGKTERAWKAEGFGWLVIFASVIVFISTFFTVSIGKGSKVETIESRPLAAFEVEEVKGVTGNALSFLVYSSFEAELGGEESYTVMEDELGDGGLVKKSYPVDEVRVYEDADDGSARVEEVAIYSRDVTGTVLGIPVSGYMREKEETHIHVPEGTLDMARLAEERQGE